MIAAPSCEDARVAESPVEWSDLRILLALARSGSMVAAAKSLRVEHTTVGRRIAALEAALGARLVTRARSGATLTDAGREAVRAAEEMERAHEALTRRLAQATEAPSGRVRVTLTDGLAPILMRSLSALTERYPALEVEVQSTPLLLSIEKGEADIGLRMVKPEVATLVARRISTIGWSLFASAEYVARRGAPDDVERLAGHELVGFDASLERTPGARWLAAADRGGRVVVRANTITAMSGLVAAGQGLGIVPCFTATGLVRLTPRILTTSELFAVVHEEQRDVPRIRVVLDHVVEAFLAERDRLEGLAPTL